MKSEVFTQKIRLSGEEKIIVKIKEHEDEVSDALKDVRHFALAEIYGVERRDGKTFVEEEFVYGISLDGVLRGKGLPIGWSEEFSVEEIAGIGVQLCKGVRVLHGLKQPILHGDIKPENVILQKRNPISVKLIDCDDGFFWRPNTCYPTMKGTPGFCAPEQTTAGVCDYTVDVYGVGRTLDFLLLGSPTTMSRKRKMLSRIIKKATSDHPNDRYVTVKELEDELKLVL